VRVPASHAPLISRENFQEVQERLDQRRPSTTNRHVSPFLLSGLTYCAHCGNKMIGVTRKQRWQRGDGTMRSAQYRYYQCESRTNRSLCDYHTRRAEALEEAVRLMLSDPSSLHRKNGKGTIEDHEVVMAKLRDKVRRLDKRLEQVLDSAVGGEIDNEKLLDAATTVASQQLVLEAKLNDAGKQAKLLATEKARHQHVQAILARLTAAWETLEFESKQELLREALERIDISDDEIRIIPRT